MPEVRRAAWRYRLTLMMRGYCHVIFACFFLIFSYFFFSFFFLARAPFHVCACLRARCHALRGFAMLIFAHYAIMAHFPRHDDAARCRRHCLTPRSPRSPPPGDYRHADVRVRRSPPDGCAMRESTPRAFCSEARRPPFAAGGVLFIKVMRR